MLSHDTLLLASGSSEYRRALRDIFEDSFHLLEANNDQQAMLLLKQNQGCIASLLLDLSRPEGISSALLTAISQSPELKSVPVVAMTPPEDPAAVAQAFAMGAIEAMAADSDPYVLRQRVQNIVDLHRHKWHLEELVQEQASVLRHANDAMVDVLSSLIEYRSVESGQHILRIRRFTQVLLQEVARSCPRYALTEEAINLISSAAALHDIGKISIPDEILNKPGPLTPEQWQVMKGHAATGSRIILSLGDLGNQEYLRYAYNICRYHHERWDGSGYPEGLRGDNIPICAQAVGLADAYDALTTKRVYKDAIGYEQAANMIVSGECGAFSPWLLECFKHAAGRFAQIARSYADGHSPKSEQFDTRLPGPSQQEELNALHMVQAKYQMLLHHMDATLVEIDLQQGVYHVIYNPDPNLASLGTESSIQGLASSLLDLLSLPEDQERFQQIAQQDIPRFLQEGLLRQHFRFHIRSRITDALLPYNVTVLRQNLAAEQGKKIIVIWQRHAGHMAPPQPDIPSAQLPGHICLRNDKQLTILQGLPVITRLLKKSGCELPAANSLMDYILPQDRPQVRQDILDQLSSGKEVELEFRLGRQACFTWLLCKLRLTVREDGMEYFQGIVLDISKTKHKQNLLQQELDRQKIILSQTENVMFEWDMQADTVTFSENWVDIFGYEPMTRDLNIRIATDSHFHPEDIPILYELLHRMRSGENYQVCEVRIAKTDGRYLWCRFRATGLRDEEGILTKIVGIIINIDAEKKSAQALKERAEQDMLTKLLNKQAVRDQAEKYLSGLSPELRCALFIIDLDNFKQINDRYGHMFGDAVLTQVAREIKRLFRPQDLVARIGGDEFLVLMRGPSDRNLVQARCGQLIAAFHNILRSHLQGDHLSCSIGAALFPTHGLSYNDLFRHADQALYQAKDLGKNTFAIYDSTLSIRQGREKLVSAINERIDSDDQQSIAGSNIIQYAFRHLYESGDVEATIQEILALAGQQMNVSRVYIFENDSANTHCSNTFEWCNQGIPPQKDLLQNVSYETDIPTFIENFNEQGIFYCPDISQLPPDLYEILAPQNVKSVLMCAIREGGVFRGYMGFDECTINRYWTKEQIRMLTFFSEMISVFLLKKRTQDENARRASELTQILDTHNVPLHVVDPETYRLRFLNARARRDFPGAEEGMVCYQCLMGRDAPCDYCPVGLVTPVSPQIRSTITDSDGRRIRTEGTLIRWENQPACMVAMWNLDEEP